MKVEDQAASHSPHRPLPVVFFHLFNNREPPASERHIWQPEPCYDSFINTIYFHLMHQIGAALKEEGVDMYNMQR